MTALWAEGCGIALSGDEHEVSVTFLSFASPVSITKCKSPLPQAEVLQRTSEPGSYLSIACTLSEHLNARPSVSP